MMKDKLRFYSILINLRNNKKKMCSSVSSISRLIKMVNGTVVNSLKCASVYVRLVSGAGGAKGSQSIVLIYCVKLIMV